MVLVNDCRSDVSPVNISDSESDLFFSGQSDYPRSLRDTIGNLLFRIST